MKNVVFKLYNLGKNGVSQRKGIINNEYMVDGNTWYIIKETTGETHHVKANQIKEVL